MHNIEPQLYLIAVPGTCGPDWTDPTTQVSFKIEFQAGAVGRNYGWVKLDEVSLAAEVAREGWARVKDQGTSNKSSELEELAELGKAAETAKLGIFTDDSAKQAHGVSLFLDMAYRSR